MTRGVAGGDPRAAREYMEARRRPPEEAPGGGGNRALVAGLARLLSLRELVVTAELMIVVGVCQ